MAVRGGRARYSWICPNASERARFMALHGRLSHANKYILAVMAICLIPAVLYVDHPAATVSVAVVAFVQYGLIQRLAPRFPRPELWIFGSLLAAEFFMCVAVILSGFAGDGALGLMFWPAAGLAGRFPNRVVIVGTAFTIVLLLAGFALGDPSVFTDAPFLVTGHLGVVIAFIATVSVVRLSDVAHHSAATTDALTGLHSRTALGQRTEEIEREESGGEVALVVLDLDHFKTVNDAHGHQAGDEVLAAFGARLAACLPEPAAAYRVGGEEFAVLAPGLDLVRGAALAERLLAVIRAEPLAGHRVTASAGVAATGGDGPVRWAPLYAEADAALYRAKADGRDRVRPQAPPVALRAAS